MKFGSSGQFQQQTPLNWQYQYPYNYYHYGQYNPYFQYLPPVQKAQNSTKTNDLSIAAFVLSVVWFFGIGSLIAIVLGAVSLRQVKNSKDTQSGSGFSIAAIVAGIGGVLLAVLYGIGFSFIFSNARSIINTFVTPQSNIANAVIAAREEFSSNNNNFIFRNSNLAQELNQNQKTIIYIANQPNAYNQVQVVADTSPSGGYNAKFGRSVEADFAAYNSLLKTCYVAVVNEGSTSFDTTFGRNVSFPLSYGSQNSGGSGISGSSGNSGTSTSSIPASLDALPGTWFSSMFVNSANECSVYNPAGLNYVFSSVQ